MRILTIAVIISLLQSSRGSASEADLLQEAQLGHRSARQAIQTLDAKFKLELTHPERSMIRIARYIRIGDAVRITEGTEGTDTVDVLVDKGALKAVTRKWASGRIQNVAAYKDSISQHTLMSDAWSELQIELPNDSGYGTSYDQLLSEAVRPPSVERARLDGNRCLKITFTTKQVSGRETVRIVWHDLARNYLIRQVEILSLSGALECRNTLTEFAEPEPGVYVPVRCERAFYSDGKLFQAQVATLSDVVVNRPIPTALLKLPQIPAGTIMRDLVKGVMGPVDADWNPTGAMAPRKRLQVLDASPRVSEDYAAQSPADEPRSAGYWLALGATGLAILALGAALGRRLLRHRDAI